MHSDSSDDDPATYAKGEEPIDLRAAQILQDEASGHIACHQDAYFLYDPAAGYWSRVPDTTIKVRALDALKRIHVRIKVGTGDSATEADSFRFGSAHHVDDTTKLLRTVAGTGPLERPEPPHVVVFTNGTYNLRTRTLEPHNPDHGATYAITGPFKPLSAPPPELHRVITTCFPEGAEPIIRAYFRWLIDPTIPYEKIFHFVGMTGSGKGLLIDAGIALLPSRSVMSLKYPALLKDADEVYKYALGRRLLAFPDCPVRLASNDKDLNIFYEIAENKPVPARRLSSSASEASPLFARAVIGSVGSLQLGVEPDGFLRRVLSVHTNPRKGDPDPTLRRNLNGEAGAITERHHQIRGEIASWALAMPLDEVLAVLAKDDPEGILRDTAADAEASTDTASCWVDRCLMPHLDGPQAVVSEDDWMLMFESYLGWSKADNAQKTLRYPHF